MIRWLGPVALAAVGLAGATGCLSPTEAESARVQVTGSEGGVVFVLTSSRFAVAGQNGGSGEVAEPRFFSADSGVVEVPFEATEDISGTRRFFVRVTPPDTSAEAVPDRVTLEVSVDSEQRFRRTANIFEDTLSFRFISQGG